MNKHQGAVQIVLLLIALLIIFSILGAFIYQKQLNGVPGAISKRIAHLYSSMTPASIPSAASVISPTPSETPACDCSWAITSGTNVEFLVTSPSGQQTGYLQVSHSYVNNIPDASYGLESGIADATGQSPPLPDMNYFGMNNPVNGVYELLVIGKRPGKYHLDVSFVFGPMNGKTKSIDGTLVANRIDKYVVTLPDGEIQ